MATETQDWRAEARDLKAQGKSEREIADVVKKARSTVHEATKDIEPGDNIGPAPALANGHGDPKRVPEPTPGQQTIDGGEVLQREEPPPVEEIRVDGTAQIGLFDAGGKRPQSASLRLSGGKILLVDGKAFRKGDVIRGEFTAVVREVGQRDKPDPATGIVVSAEQKHVAQITDLTVNG